MKQFLILLTFALCMTTASHAEKADATKPTNIEADQMEYDDVKQINVFTGNVVMTRGTLIAKAGRAVVRQDPEGYQYGVFYAAPGKLASFRQKRDGGPDLWMEGYAERIEYDNKSEIAKFFSKARLKRMEGTKVTDDVSGEYISYDAKTEFFNVHNTSKGVSEPGAGRIKVIIQPKEKETAKQSAKNTKSAAAKGAPGKAVEAKSANEKSSADGK